MAHFLVADDEAPVRDSICQLLEGEKHTYSEAGSILEIVRAVRRSEEDDGEPFDLILLDYDFGGSTGIDAIKHIKDLKGFEYCEYRFVIITGNSQRGLASEFANHGAIGHLLKPVSVEQFWATIDNAIIQRENNIDKKNDWESALELLDNLGILENVTSLQGISQQFEQLQYIHNELLEKLRTANGLEQISNAYAAASNTLNSTTQSFDVLYFLIKDYGYTEDFIREVKDVYDRDRLQFLSLQSYLSRINNNSINVRVKHLSPGADGHYEYRIGRNYRLYFRKEGSKKVFERFGHKNVQDGIIRNLNSSVQQDISEKTFVS